MSEIITAYTVGAGRDRLRVMLQIAGPGAAVFIVARDDLGGERPRRTDAGQLGRMVEQLERVIRLEGETDTWAIGDRDDSGFASPVVSIELIRTRRSQAVLITYDPAQGSDCSFK